MTPGGVLSPAAVMNTYLPSAKDKEPGRGPALLIREQMPFLQASVKPDFRITPEVREQLRRISLAQIDLLLKTDKAALRGKAARLNGRP